MTMHLAPTIAGLLGELCAEDPELPAIPGADHPDLCSAVAEVSRI
ncbi:hypothetical protein P3102_10510 [Amycolatopsis sp. QT-25]|nr:hypothetical protein [Amycolatopsis sp. QT-25]WET83478.1 hypothetical protein P3102_10510 [Amycolatopsis sp. QT-25]